ncbi:MAG: hypothetical protein LBE12_16320 [Planctomycetaceae bacterium]|nr:hypothetical protein [Planctomycetaceae bacterium]
MVHEQRVKTVNYQVCRNVVETHTKNVAYKVCKLVPEQRVRQCNYTVLKPVTCEKTVTGCRIEASKVPYTVTRSVPRMVTYKVPVQIYKPKPCVPPCLPVCE